ncbi:MAG TPA: assimilatory sulfite reductase (NADPH) flavoprotein subunit [Steroidobacteraceae bacterium]|jgi:sulfite reductase (NADPH) flavoprotein alpha-component|nr:assimilatory sulfite reductase (NADPH) flavoprotein subunit [Steroidobacteraceae bacterium]
MSSGVVIQGNFPIPDDRRDQLQQLATELNREQLMWLSGYFAGAAAVAPSSIPAFQPNLLGGQARAHAQPAAPTAFTPAATAPAAAAVAAPSLTIISASHTGNGRKISEKLLAAVQALGVQARMVKAGDYQPREIAREKLLYIVISTHGDGDPPDEARGLYEFLGTKRAPQLPELQYSVLALGDSSYPKFCEAGRIVDERLAKLGAKRLLPRVDCDVDFEKLAKTWSDDALARVREVADKFKPAGGPAFAAAPAAAAAPAIAELKREQPATAEVLANQRIVGRGALREVRHVELSFPGLGNLYKPGDALGIVHRNPEPAIEAVLKATKLDAAASVTHEGKTHALLEWLRNERELTRIARPLLTAIADRSKADLSELLDPRNPAALTKLTATAQVADVLAKYPAEWTPEALVAALRPVHGRVYSIASSPAAVGDEAHLTVAVVGSDTDRKLLAGAASHFVVNTPVDSNVQVWIERNERFRVPADGARDIIMIGPGTGVAPFRGFVQEREAMGATGRNWLFFGGRSLYHDFLYQLEWQQALKRNALHRLDVAFSRDQERKIYVQHRLREAGKDLFAWLSNGACLYVCGDATAMAPDVHAALLDVVREQGGMDADDAQAWVADLTADGRYLRDVY